MKKTLAEIPPGARARIVAVNGHDRATKRLLEMGVVPGETVRVVKTAPFGDPLEVRVRGYHLAMRKNEADRIEVAEIQ